MIVKMNTGDGEEVIVKIEQVKQGRHIIGWRATYLDARYEWRTTPEDSLAGSPRLAEERMNDFLISNDSLDVLYNIPRTMVPVRDIRLCEEG